MSNWDLLINSGWGFGLTIVALASIGFNVYQFFANRKTRFLKVLFTTEPFGQAVKDLLQRSNQKIDIPHLTRFRIALKVTGNVDLSSDDFESPLEFLFGTNIEFLQTEINEEAIVSGKICYEKDRILINPFLLKSGEEITITGFVTSTDFVEIHSPKTRVKGFKLLKWDSENDSSAISNLKDWVYPFIISIFLGSISFPLLFNKGMFDSLTTFLPTIVGMGVSIFILNRILKIRK